MGNVGNENMSTLKNVRSAIDYTALDALVCVKLDGTTMIFCLYLSSPVYSIEFVMCCYVYTLEKLFSGKQ